MAPEAFQKNSGFSSDVWALGIIFYNLISDSFPFEGETYTDLFEAASFDLLEFHPSSAWSDVPVEVINLISKMLDKSAKNRISIDEVVSHVCFDQIIKLTRQVELTEEEIQKLNQFKNLTPLSRGILSYAVRYLENILSKTITSGLSERFIFLDGNNIGSIPIINPELFKMVKGKSTTELPNMDTYMTAKTIRLKPNNKLTHSEFLAALVSSELFKVENISGRMFDDLNPNSSNKELTKVEFVKNSFFLDKKEEMEANLEEWIGDSAITKEWLGKFIKSIKF